MKNDPAFPAPTDVCLSQDSNLYRYGEIRSAGGLSKREIFAAMAMQGLWASPHPIPALEQLGVSDGDSVCKRLATCAVASADALLAELERTK